MVFGIFIFGVCLGGGVSNIYLYLLDGDLLFLIIMIIISIIVVLGNMDCFDIKKLFIKS